MIQPFELFKPVYLDRLIKLKKIYLVSQSYSRGDHNYPEAALVDILVSDYDDLHYAQVHYNAVKQDKYASIIHLDQIEHKNKLDQMINGEKYAVYWSVVTSLQALQKKLDNQYAENVRRYISKHTSWRIKSDTSIRPKFEVIFGELFLIIKYNSQILRVKFEEIEKT